MIDQTIDVHPLWTTATQQLMYRRLLLGMSYPGRVIPMADLLNGAMPALALAATLLDQESSLADPDDILGEDNLRLIGAPQADDPAWFVCNGQTAPAPDFSPSLGSIAAPEDSATIIISGLRFDSGQKLPFKGPGIRGELHVQIGDWNPAWLELRQQCCARPPLGIDFILCSADQLMCLPRSTQIMEQ